MISRKTHLVLVAWALLAGLAAGCSRGGSTENGPPGGPGGRGSQPIPVAAVEVRPRELARTVTVTGPIEPIRTVSVNAQTAGHRAARSWWRRADRVRTGQLMAELDARETAAQLERARAVLANAEAAYRRAEQLQANDLTSAAELDALRSAFEIAKADVELWRTRLAFSRITAPVSGVVTAKQVEQGSTVSTNQAMFEIADDSLLVVRVRVSELDVVHLQPGRPVTLQLDAYPGRADHGTHPAHLPQRRRREPARAGRGGPGSHAARSGRPARLPGARRVRAGQPERTSWPSRRRPSASPTAAPSSTSSQPTRWSAGRWRPG